jgi:hypothetical protein
MITPDELAEIAADFQALRDIIRPLVGMPNSNPFRDMRNAEQIAGMIVAARQQSKEKK